MNLILYCPEIPPNTGNVARLTAGLGLTLHLIEPLGFSLDDRYLRRAGLDYWPLVDLRLWKDFEAFLAQGLSGRLIATSARAGQHFSQYQPEPNDNFIFGPETKGLPARVIDRAEALYTIPLKP
ncbi:MAG: tRNA (uridine(34)/cytosine(34)/5-carboxymethylaminomethyluridine(34)-2'-O)-methyltransferase TrmL, partial [Deltaproteobacteria bacterium]|nr:tRNA (uridine(34)/cytosine(34)/5-carboxymethylaminomethyluridine(34)-2'-O)-methyltransferase TrmL [Deltaproteobacteria bacterium]